MLRWLSGWFSAAYLLDHCYFAQNNGSDKNKNIFDVDGTSQKPEFDESRQNMHVHMERTEQGKWRLTLDVKEHSAISYYSVVDLLHLLAKQLFWNYLKLQTVRKLSI
jgi:hypothetical protein